MANRLSNEELRKALQDYGEDVGPITPSTRSTWERRLAGLRKGKGQNPPKNNALNAFSSDDSEIENSVTNIARKKRTYTRANSGERSEKLSLIRPREINSSPDSDIFKKPVAIPIPVLSQEKKTHLYHRTTQNSNRKGKKDGSKKSSYDIETSDSDLDAVESSFTKSPRLRRKPLGSNFSTDLHGMGLRRSDGATTSYNSIFQRKSLNSWTSETERNFHHFSPTLDRLKREHSGPTYQVNGYLSNTLSNGDFSEEKTVQGSSTNYSHCVSWFLLLAAIAFFVTIGVLYMTEVQKTSLSASKNYSKFCRDVKEDQCKPLILISRELHHLLTTVAGDFECGSAKSRNMTVQEARVIMRDFVSADSTFKMEDFDAVFNHSLTLFKKNPVWGVNCLFLSEVTPALIPSHSQLDYISALEATQAAKSFWCRVRLSIANTVTKILVTLGVGLFLFVMFLFVKFWKKRREAQEKLFYEMVEKVIDIMQDSGESSQGDSLSGSCKAVVNVRDALIPPKDRKTKLWLWERVVSFIEENESRVSVEYQKINGEDFKVWRWNPSTTHENDGTKQGKVWQGQGKGKNATYTPSPCLKIRNMFDPEVEYGNDWQVSIRDAILEKCEGNNGIRHIAFETMTNNEGCVFMLCSSLEAAGKAYNDLHGWWFDGKLVTVKYIKLSRYLERFPGAEQYTEPLKPSNNKRLSLSTPFFSSALERS
ncbi:inner nuclear membrane protein Man1 [Caerostris extrusa]|uniref:Inner nuclear membrane protein Man1 n=1 Tax=Caerostris extrusa TaxID=172846 RepID=A0AAV4XKX3_CAEEX|nr:inner nuclear membrane protein Man1 [Caerostris extrusa]